MRATLSAELPPAWLPALLFSHVLLLWSVLMAWDCSGGGAGECCILGGVGERGFPCTVLHAYILAGAHMPADIHANTMQTHEALTFGPHQEVRFWSEAS